VSSPQLAYPHARRSSRINHAMLLTVQASDAAHTPYIERVLTETLSCHGCRYRSKNGVLQDDVVVLELENPDGRIRYSNRARVKQVRQLPIHGTPFEVVVELESPGNIWGVASPPADWFPVREALGIEPSTSLREIPSVPRPGPQMALASGRPVQMSHVEKNDLAGSLYPFFAQLMVGFGEQIQIMTAEAATAGILKEKGRLLDEFRTQLQNEASKTLQHVMATSKQELAGQALKELSEAHEATARAAYDRWTNQMEQEFGNIAQRIVALGNKVNERADGAAAGTLDRMQSKMDASRRDAVDQFRSRLRSEVTPLLEEAQTTLQKLRAFEKELKATSSSCSKQFEEFLQQETSRVSSELQEKISGCQKQVEASVTETVSKGTDELNRKSTATVESCADALRALAQGSEQAAESRLASLTESMVDEATNKLKKRTAELSRQFSEELQEYRNYLELISGTIAEIAKKPAGHSRA
jgi:hypothetical protein